MTYQEIVDKAREVMAPKCRVCPECNGLACRGEIPDIGGIGIGAGFIECRIFFKSIKLNMDAVHEDYEINPSTELLGQELAETMRMTDCRTFADITPDKLA